MLFLNHGNFKLCGFQLPKFPVSNRKFWELTSTQLRVVKDEESFPNIFNAAMRCCKWMCWPILRFMLQLRYSSKATQEQWVKHWHLWELGKFLFLRNYSRCGYLLRGWFTDWLYNSWLFLVFQYLFSSNVILC